MRTITPSEAIKSKDALFIDVRTPSEYESEHIRSSISIPLDTLSRRKDEIRAGRGHVILVCRSGNRAKKACEQLAEQKNVSVLKGGIQSWKQENLPLIIGAPSWDIERQVRLTAGSLVVAGSLVGYFIHPAGYALSFAIGAGLAFAAITNTCAMGMLLLRMPWNRSKEKCAERSA